MKDSLKSYIPVVYICSLILICLWSSIAIFYLVTPIFCIILLNDLFKHKTKPQSFKINSIDIAVLIILASELIGYFFSIYKPNSFPYLFKFSLLTLFYFFYRYIIKFTWQQNLITTFVAFYCLVLSLLTVFYFFLFYFNITTEGFANITEFRNFYAPMGIHSNEWVTVLLALLPFQIITLNNYYQNKLLKIVFGISVPITVFCILISFSRGAYIAFAAFVIISVIWLIKSKILTLKTIVIGYSFFIIISTICIAPFYKYVLSTISMFNTTSQQRSFEGRTNILKNTFTMFKEYPITGIGSNNFPLRYGSQINNVVENTFASRIANTMLQIIIEKGILGILSYGILLFIFIKMSLKRLKKKLNPFNIFSTIFFLCTILAICLRELSFSTLFETNSLLFLVFIIFLLNTHESMQGDQPIVYE